MKKFEAPGVLSLLLLFAAAFVVFIDAGTPAKSPVGYVPPSNVALALSGIMLISACCLSVIGLVTRVSRIDFQASIISTVTIAGWFWAIIHTGILIKHYAREYHDSMATLLLFLLLTLVVIKAVWLIIGLVKKYINSLNGAKN